MYIEKQSIIGYNKMARERRGDFFAFVCLNVKDKRVMG